MTLESRNEHFTGKSRNMTLTKTILSILFFVLLSGCGFYKMNGVTVPPDVKTVSIQYFENRASIVNPLLSQVVSEKLKNKFIRDTQLGLVAEDGDFSFSGTITEYTVQPVSVQENTTSTLNRLKIAVQVKLDCKKHPKMSFDQTFQNFQDFDANKSFSSVEAALVDEITEMIVQEIFNKAAINW